MGSLVSFIPPAVVFAKHPFLIGICRQPHLVPFGNALAVRVILVKCNWYSGQLQFAAVHSLHSTRLNLLRPRLAVSQHNRFIPMFKRFPAYLKKDVRDLWKEKQFLDPSRCITDNSSNVLERFDDQYNDEMGGTVPSGYDTAQVCTNGHAINECAETQPQHNSKFCAKCGAATITTCAKCNSKIRGHYYVPGVVSISIYSPPVFCHECGEAYPWTAARLEAARELARESERLDDNEKGILARSLDDLSARDTQHSGCRCAFQEIGCKGGRCRRRGSQVNSG